MAELFEILKRQMDSKGLSTQQVADSLDISKRMVQFYLQGSKFPALKNLRKLSSLLDFNMDELTENGELSVHSGITSLPTAQEKSIRKPKIDSTPYLVPFVDIPAQAGYSKAYSNIDYIQTLKLYPILPDVDPTGAVWRYFQVAGDSMEDEIREGDTLLTSLVPQMDWMDIKDYHTHVIVTDEDLLIKDVLKDGKDSIILLKLEDVKQIWVMRRHIKSRAKKTRMYNLDDIKKELDTSNK